MTNQEKINLINTIHSKVVDWSICGNECEYVAVTIDEEVKNVLYKLGKDDEWIKENSEHNTVDIQDVGFEFANWWSSKTGFTL